MREWWANWSLAVCTYTFVSVEIFVPCILPIFV
jgi:hypothetical protein